MNKNLRRKLYFLKDNWFEIENAHYKDKMSYIALNGFLTLKEIRQILEEKNL